VRFGDLGSDTSFIKALLDPGENFFLNPSHTARSEADTLRKASGLLETVNMRGRIEHQRSQVFLGEDTHRGRYIGDRKGLDNIV